ncbi:MAG: hypothetical protein ACYTHM_10815, partial [Planctomycetota bacterium]
FCIVWLALGIPSSVSGGGKEAPEGIGKIIHAFGPPDFGVFPPGTLEVKTTARIRRGERTCQVTWTFQREKASGPLVLRHGDVDVDREASPSLPFPDPGPREGPIASFKALLEACETWNPEKVGRYLPPEERERLRKDPQEAREHYAVWARLFQGSFRTLASHTLPRLLSPLKGTAAVEVQYRFPGQVGEEKGIYDFRLAMEVDRQKADHWVLAEFKPVFEGGDEGGAGPGENAAVPRGLLRLLDRFAVPDLGAFPEGTSRLTLRIWGRRFGGLYEIRAAFRRETQAAGLFLSGYSVRKREGLKAGMVIPSSDPAEGPIESARNALTALRAGDLARARRYLPESSGLYLGKTARELEEERAREKARRGYSAQEVVLTHLPKGIRTPGGLAGLAIEFTFPGRVGQRGGHFEIEGRLTVDRPKADHWVIQRLDAAFDED